MYQTRQYEPAASEKGLDAKAIKDGNRQAGPRRRSSALRFFSSNAPKHEAPMKSHKEWEEDYITNLRASKVARPGGSRPLPERRGARSSDVQDRAASALEIRPQMEAQPHLPSHPSLRDRCASALSHRRAQSDMPGDSVDSMANASNGSSIPDVYSRKNTRDVSGATTSSQISTFLKGRPPPYIENGMRWVEKQEARSLREALEDMDLKKEMSIQDAAEREAHELIQSHLEDRRGHYKGHLQKGAHTRSHSQAWRNLPAAWNETTGEYTVRSMNSKSRYDGSVASRDQLQQTHSPSRVPLDDLVVRPIRGDRNVSGSTTHTTIQYKLPRTNQSRRRSSANRARISSNGPFRNPDDQIFSEEPDEDLVNGIASHAESKIPVPLTVKGHNAKLSKVRPNKDLVPHIKIADSDKMERFEVYKVTSTRSRDPSYRQNRKISIGRETGKVGADQRNGMEVRSDDIRAATSMRLSDRSPKLRTPTAIRNQAKGHIVSFSDNWEALPGTPESVRPRAAPMPPRSRDGISSPMSGQSVPTITVASGQDVDSPSINITHVDVEPPASIPKISIPGISIEEPDISADHFKPRSAPGRQAMPQPMANKPKPTNRMHWTPSAHRTSAQCAACALPIAGRVVTAASQRFHPNCFSCHYCATGLECVAFYPEPEPKRAERLVRIEARINGEDVEEVTGATAAEDGDESLRFYCHLDYHELFSPRCRSCKTPIESEVVVACGGTWHVGHFFCAECGDPFDSETPFVEKDGYAWCVKCHASRFSGKCRGCRKPVVDSGINALGSDWHEHCFVCTQCGDGFPDGRFFTTENEDQPLCVGCEQRRLKA